MKQLYLIVLFSLSISAMDKIQHSYESRIWNQETFNNAWNDQGEMISLCLDFNSHFACFLIGRVDTILKKQKELGLEPNLRDAATQAESSLPSSEKAASTYKATFDTLLAEDGKPKKNGFSFLQVIRKYAFACRKYMQDTYPIPDHLRVALPDNAVLTFSDDEKGLITDTILPHVPHLSTEDRSFVLSLIDAASTKQPAIAQVVNKDEIQD